MFLANDVIFKKNDTISKNKSIKINFKTYLRT